MHNDIINNKMFLKFKDIKYICRYVFFPSLKQNCITKENYLIYIKSNFKDYNVLYI